MFGISMWEFVLIVLVALILLGPRQLAETARVVGKLYRELLKLTSEVKETINLDALTDVGAPKYEPPPKTDLPRNPAKTDEIIPSSGEKTGPDFYAELLEQSSETHKARPGASDEEGLRTQDYEVKDQESAAAKPPEQRQPIH